MMKKSYKKYVLMYIVLELILNTLFLKGKTIDVLNVLVVNSIMMVTAYYALERLIFLFSRDRKYDYINFIGMLILVIIFSSLLIDNPIVKSIILQVGSIINFFIILTIMVYYDKNKHRCDLSIWSKYQKTITYIVLCIVISFSIEDYKFSINMILVGLISLLTIYDLEKHNKAISTLN